MTEFFQVDNREMENYELILDRISSRALPIAVKQVLNQSARLGMRYGRQNVKSRMTLRNKFTEQSIRFEQADGLRIRQMQSEVGSVADYLAKQEFGGVRMPSGTSESYPIATPAASGEADGAKRLQDIRARNRRKNIKLATRRKSQKQSTGKSRMVGAVRHAVDKNRRTIFIENGKTRGIFKVVGGRKTRKGGRSRGWPKGAKLRMLWDMSAESVYTPATPWLRDVGPRVAKWQGQMYRDALRYQLKRAKLL